MNIFNEIGNIYNEIDNEYSIKEFHARSRRWVKKELEYHKKREKNDQAYFLYMFSRLEDRIKTLSNALIIRKRTSIIHWKQRSTWDILPSGSGARINFKDRLALLTDKAGSDYGLVSYYYTERNNIAHGGSFTTVVHMHTVISDLQRLYIKLRP